MPIRKKMTKEKKERENQKGSVLLLTMISVLVLSILVTGLLTVGTTEIYTTQNYQTQKSSYYLAVQGVEEVRTEIFNNPDAQSVTAITRPLPSEAKYTSSSHLLSYYILGSLLDHEKMMRDEVVAGPAVKKFEGFKPPPLPAISLGSSSSIEPVVWKVQVTANVRLNERSAFSEIISGVYSVLTVGY